MAKVIGVGGVFMKAKDPKGLAQWYAEVLGVAVQDWGGAQFPWKRVDGPGVAYTVWCPFAADTKYFAPSEQAFMVNLCVDDLDRMLAALRSKGAQVLDRREDTPQGRFGYVLDPDGTLLELWEPSPEDPSLPK